VRGVNRTTQRFRSWKCHANSNLAWSAEGTTLTSGTCDRTGVTSTQKVLRTYDAMNRVKLVDYPGSTADISYQYEADGALKILTSGTSKKGPELITV
jgi:hypothetical protein